MESHQQHKEGSKKKELLVKGWLRFCLMGLICVFLAMIICFGIINVFSDVFIRQPAVQPGAPAATMCTKCKGKEIRSFQDINDIKCKTCSGRLGFTRQCNECGNIFPFVPLNLEELPKDKFDFIKKTSKREACPKCKSQRTFPYLRDEEIINIYQQNK